jgi:hypothetical protein
MFKVIENSNPILTSGFHADMLTVIQSTSCGISEYQS